MTTQKNGSTATPEKESGKPVTTLMVAAPKKDEQKKSDGLPPLDERLNRLSQLVELQKKYNRLCASEQKLAEFKQKKGTENVTLDIDDDNRNSFSTSNPELIAEVLETVRTTIQKRKKEIEPQLVW